MNKNEFTIERLSKCTNFRVALIIGYFMVTVTVKNRMNYSIILIDLVAAATKSSCLIVFYCIKDYLFIDFILN